MAGAFFVDCEHRESFSSFHSCVFFSFFHAHPLFAFLLQAFKPTSTIGQLQNTVTREGEETTMRGKGRHDPCVLPRAAPMVEVRRTPLARACWRPCLWHFAVFALAARRILGMQGGAWGFLVECHGGLFVRSSVCFPATECLCCCRPPSRSPACEFLHTLSAHTLSSSKLSRGVASRNCPHNCPPPPT